MSITDILIRSISGYVFVLPGVLLYFGYLMRRKKQTLVHFVASIVFCYYLVGIHAFKAFSPRLVLVTFVDMISGPVDTTLNVILFIPLGFFLPLLYKKYNRVNRVALTGFLFSISIEIVQIRLFVQSDGKQEISMVQFSGCHCFSGNGLLSR